MALGNQTNPGPDTSVERLAPGPMVPVRASTDRLPMYIPLQRQPTIFKIDIDFLEVTRNRSSSLQINKPRNIVIFGDSGVGKSSLINMLAGHKIAETSSGVLGCTFQSNRYTIAVDGEKVNVWDTTGLDEGTRGRVQPGVAEKNLVKLLRELRSANGVHLLVYCIRGPTVRKSLARNYVIFYSAICRKKVPIVAVVTGLENEEPSMEDWWIRGEKELTKYKMRFNDHACVTTIDKEKLARTVFEERSILSQQLVRKLIVDNCRRTATRPSSDTNVFIKAALHDFRSVVRFGWDNVQPLCSVVFSQTDIALFRPGFFGDLRKVNSQINERSFVFHHAGNLSERYITPRISKGGADLLIFAGTMSDSNKKDFRKFYNSCSGEVCPVLVVTDDPSVKEWMEHLDAQGIGARVTSIPSSSTDGQPQVALCDTIDELCLVRGLARYHKTNLLGFFKRTSKETSKENVFSQTDIALFRPGFFGDLRKVNSQINERSFVFHYAGDLSERYITPRISKGGPDLLIFAGTMSDSNKKNFRKFYDSCSGEVCPVLIVTDDLSVKEWMEHLDTQGIGARVTSIPSSPTDGQPRMELCDTIDELSLVRWPARYRKTNNLLTYIARRSRKFFPPLALINEQLFDENESSCRVSLLAPSHMS